jgi:hypothetical protein
MLQATRKATARGRSGDPSALIGPEALTGDMSGDDIAFVLRRITADVAKLPDLPRRTRNAGSSDVCFRRQSGQRSLAP